MNKKTLAVLLACYVFSTAMIGCTKDSDPPDPLSPGHGVTHAKVTLEKTEANTQIKKTGTKKLTAERTPIEPR